MIWFIVAGLVYGLDFLDGYVARKTMTCSEFGADFDPLGDKLVAISMLMLMVSVHFFPMWVLSIIIFRELVVTSIRHASKKYDVEFKTSSMGKFRTNVIGFGGGLLYVSQYWNEKSAWILIAVLSCILFLNLIFARDKFLMKHYKNSFEKFVVFLTLFVAAIYPVVTIPISMLLITVYTLVDYSIGFYVGARGHGIASKFWFVRLYLFVFTKRYQDPIDKQEALKARMEKVLAKIKGKIKALNKKEQFIKENFEKRILASSNERRWTKISIFLLMNTVIALLMAGLLSFGLYFTWVGKYTLPSAIMLMSFIFIGQLIAKILENNNNTTTQQQLFEANSDNGT